MRRAVVAFFGVAVLLAACSGSGSSSSASSTPGGGGGPYAGSAAATSSAGASAASAGPSANGGQTGAAPDACALLTPADATTALGTAAGTPDVHTGGGNNCTYGTADPNVSATVEISVFQKTIFDHAKATTSNGVTIVPLSGVGDDAFYFDGGPIVGTQLYVLKGAVGFYVAIYDHSRSADQIGTAEQTTAEAALGHF